MRTGAAGLEMGGKVPQHTDGNVIAYGKFFPLEVMRAYRMLWICSTQILLIVEESYED
jgi:hypothetical protein